MFNALTIDIEDYFQVHAFSNVIKYEDWDNYECRVERNTDHLLELLNGLPQTSVLKPHSSVKATFFILGWIANRYPDLVRRIQKEGHEIACHGYAHKLVYTQSKEEFRDDIRKAKAILEDITGNEVIGYRAPSYSITEKSKWAFEILIEEGFKYDSSIFPIRHDFYGIPNAPRFPFVIFLNGTNSYEISLLNYESLETHNSSLITHNFELNNLLTHSHYNSKNLIEFPISTVKLLGMNLPISGGGYFRLFPYSLIKKALKSINEKEIKPFIFYMHPWEIDTDQPRINNVPVRSKLRHYINLEKTENRFQILLRDFNFSSVKDTLEYNNLLTH